MATRVDPSGSEPHANGANPDIKNTPRITEPTALVRENTIADHFFLSKQH
jgi:hypothetical protein